MAFFGYTRGHRVNTETSCLSTIPCLPKGWILSLEPSGFENRLSQRQSSLPWHRFSQHAQAAACCFNSSGSKCAPFFQTVKTMVAIFRANVRRAIEGFIPLASKFR